MWFLVVIISTLLAVYLYLDTRKPKNFPPGPAWIPIFGSALQVTNYCKQFGDNLCLASTQMAKDYSGGKLVGMRIGNELIVIMTSMDGYRELAANHDLDGRPKGPFYTLKSWGLRRGIICVDEEFWQEQRRFLTRHLRDFGFGKSDATCESKCFTEALALINYFKKLIKNSPNGVANVELHNAFSISMVNSIWSMLSGKRYDPDDEKAKHLMHVLHELSVTTNMTGCLFHFFPILRYLAPEKSGYLPYLNALNEGLDILQEELDYHKETYVPGVERDFMDIFLAEMKSRGDDSNSNFTEQQLLSICVDMFIAGSDTSSNGLSFAFLHFLRTPEVVKKAKEEMDRVVGRDRLPTLADKPNLPYMDAIVCETLRVFIGQGISIPHRAIKDTVVHGYNIPKDTTVIMNSNGIHFNEEFYDEPLLFKPERFLDENGKVKIPENYAPFGLGRRRCLGYNLGRTNVYLFITNLLHTFNFNNPEGSPLPDPFPVEGIVVSTQPYKAAISLRTD